MHYVFAQFTDETSDEYVLLQLVLFIWPDDCERKLVKKKELVKKKKD
jgi:hypothetical protein